MANIVLTEEQFNKLLDEIRSLKQEVEELKEQRKEYLSIARKKPVILTSEEREIKEREELINSPEVRKAVEYAIADFKLNPPKKY